MTAFKKSLQNGMCRFLGPVPARRLARRRLRRRGVLAREEGGGAGRLRTRGEEARVTLQSGGEGHVAQGRDDGPRSAVDSLEGGVELRVRVETALVYTLYPCPNGRLFRRAESKLKFTLV